MRRTLRRRRDLRFYVPAIADRYETKEENFALFKVVSTHQVARLEFGSFWFEFETPSTVFKDLRFRLEKEVMETAQSNGDGTDWVTDIQRLFGLLEDRRLSLDLFTIIEGGRLDIRVLTEYLGMRRSYARVQGDALAAAARDHADARSRGDGRVPRSG